jgi:hypothetical protein
MMVALSSMLLVLSAVAQIAGPRPAVLASAWARALVVLLPSVLLLPVAPAWVPAQIFSAARAVELPPSVLAAWARTAGVLLPMVPGL